MELEKMNRIELEKTNEMESKRINKSIKMKELELEEIRNQHENGQSLGSCYQNGNCSDKEKLSSKTSEQYLKCIKEIVLDRIEHMNISKKEALQCLLVYDL
ncbi:14103_t:CDS:2, partial [Cetraspora pellucida]